MSAGIATSEKIQGCALINYEHTEVKNEPQVHELTSKDLIPFMRIRLEGDTLFAVSNPESF